MCHIIFEPWDTNVADGMDVIHKWNSFISEKWIDIGLVNKSNEAIIPDLDCLGAVVISPEERIAGRIGEIVNCTRAANGSKIELEEVMSLLMRNILFVKSLRHTWTNVHDRVV